MCFVASVAYPIETKKIILMKQIEVYEIYPPSQEMLAFAIRDMGIKFPEMVFKQAMLESGWLKSRLAKKQNNLFGMKMPRKRETFATKKGKNNYAYYESWAHSVADYKLYQDNRNITDINSFLSNSKYSQTHNYKERLMAIKIPDKIKQILNS
jgi:uncharacterized FlgJ-related protein